MKARLAGVIMHNGLADWIHRVATRERGWYELGTGIHVVGLEMK